MRRLLRTGSLGCLLIGAALWFFGGMNTGPSQWSEEAHAADGTMVLGTERRHVFRPGLGFLGGAAVLGAALWGCSFAAGRDRGH